MARSTRASSVLFALIVSIAFISGCGELDEFEDDFDTEFTVPKPEGLTVEPFTKNKRFKMESDPADAESVKFKRAKISVQAPAGSDLSFLSRIEIYIEKDSELTLVADAEGFSPGERSRSLSIVYKGDLRQFVDDQRVRLTWIVYPTAWGYDWPDEGVDIKTDVTFLINANIF